MSDPKARRVPTPREAVSADRIQTAHQRSLPDFIIIGAQKGGTTSLYRYLNQHPAVDVALHGEIHFFDRSFANGIDWYLAQFPLRDAAKIVGEKSPNYLYHPKVPRRLRAAIPNVKLIALLRNPIDRAYSQHQMNVKKGGEPLTFEEAIAREPDRLSRDSDLLSREWRLASYLTRGRYAEQLQHWWDVFPRDQLLIIKSEEFYATPEETYLRTLAFLNLPPWRLPQYRVHQYWGESEPMRPETRARLATYFAPHNRRLYDLLGRDLGWD